MQPKARMIVREEWHRAVEEWHRAVKELGLLRPGSQVETVVGRILNRIDGLPQDRPRRALAWAVEIFGACAIDLRERALRFIEEAVELVHAIGLPRETLDKVIDRIYSKPLGNVPREIGQAALTLELLAEVCDVSADGEAELEFARVQGIPKAEWDRRHAAKVDLGIATK